MDSHFVKKTLPSLNSVSLLYVCIDNESNEIYDIINESSKSLGGSWFDISYHRRPLTFKSNIQNIYYLREETFVNMYNLFLKYICLISESWILVWVVGLWASSVCLDRPKSLLEHGMGGRNEISLGEFKF